MEYERYENRVPLWVDMGSPDLSKAKEFYGGLFGWNCPDGPAEGPGGYTEWKLGGTRIVPPMAIEPGRFATLADPVGAMFNVLALKPEFTS